MSIQRISLPEKQAILGAYLKAPNASFIRLKEGHLEVVPLKKGDTKVGSLYTQVFAHGSDIWCLKEQEKDITQLFAVPSSYDSGLHDSEEDCFSEDEDCVHEASDSVGDFEFIDQAEVVKGFAAFTLTPEKARESLSQVVGVEASDLSTIKDALSAIDEFALRSTKHNFNTLECNLKNLPDVLKQHISDQGLFEKLLGSRCIANCNERFPLFIIEIALNPEPKEFKNFLTKFVNDASRNSHIEFLKQVVLLDKDSKELVSYIHKQLSEERLGYSLPSMTYDTLSKVLNYIEYATNQGLEEKIKALISQAGGKDSLEIKKAEQRERLVRGFEKAFEQILPTPDLVEATSLAQYIRKLEKTIRSDITGESRSYYPIGFEANAPLRCLDEEGVAKLKAEVHEFALSLGLNLDEEKQAELERVLLFCSTQASFPPLVNYLKGNYTKHIANDEASALDLKYEGEKSIVFIPLQNGFRVHIQMTYLHQVSLEDESLLTDAFITQQDMQKVRKKIGIGPQGKTFAEGSFDVIINPEKIGHQEEYQKAFQMMSFKAHHEFSME